jgi:PEP-CTERM motif
VPEPGTFGLLAAGTLGVLRRGRVPRRAGERLMAAGNGG